MAIPVWPEAPGTNAPPPGRPVRRRATGVYLSPLVPWSPWVGAVVPPSARAGAVSATSSDGLDRQIPRGWVHLDIDAAVWPDVYVDGYFIGRLDELPRPLELAAGPHSLRLSAEGFEDLRVEVRVATDRAITYRGTLRRLATDTAPDPVSPRAPVGPAADSPRGSATFYVIPGCYVGNVQPAELDLPAGCDLDRLRVLSPR